MTMTTTSVTDLAALGWTADLDAAFAPHAERGLQPGRIAVQHRDLYHLLSEQGELLEGPDLTRPYHEQVTELLASGCSWVEFDNFVFWYADAADGAVLNPVERLRHYSLYESASARIRGWRLSCTNERKMGNANPPLGSKSPVNFPLRHYPMRSAEHARRRASHDRNQPGFQRGNKNWHYQRFREDDESHRVPAESLHRFDGASLDPEVVWEFYRRPDGV